MDTVFFDLPSILDYMNMVIVIRVACLIIGFAFVTFEIFEPGLGAPGITGGIFLLIGILTFGNLMDSMIALFVIIVLLAIMVFIAYQSAKKGLLAKKIILGERFSKELGYSTSKSYKSLLGLEGITITVLRPAGKAKIDDKEYDVVSAGRFIDEDEKVKVVEVEGSRIVVSKIEQ